MRINKDQQNNITLKGQSGENNAHFAAFILSLLLDFNIISILILLDKVRLVSLWLNNEYKIISLVGCTYLIIYILFIRKDKYKTLKEKYSGTDIVQKRRVNYYLGFYVAFTFILLFVVIML